MSTKKSGGAGGGINPADWINQTEAAALRGVSVAAINQLVRAGDERLRTQEVAGRTLVHRQDVLNFKPRRPGPARSDAHA